MFVIRVKNAVDYQAACDILAGHDVYIEMEYHHDHGGATMVITPRVHYPEGDVPAGSDIEEGNENFRLCEMHFQNVFHSDVQGGTMVFTKQIKYAF